MTCPAHNWSFPCATCNQRERHADERLNRIWRLGHTLMQVPSQKAIHVKSPRRRFMLPEVDPVTMTNTGGVREFVEVRDGE